MSDSKLKTLSDIFSEDIEFVIPDYQRGYSWERVPQLNDFWDDLENMAPDGSHYTGMITLCKDENNSKRYYIVDGQQRLTTIIILINELLKRIEGGIPQGKSVEDYKRQYLFHYPYGSHYPKYSFQYCEGDPSDSFFKTEILGVRTTDYSLQPKTLYTNNLVSAQSFFREKTALLDQSQLHELFNKVTQSLKFNEYLIEDIDEVYVTFETMNNRGKSLSTLELLKNRMIYLTTLLSYADPDDETLQGDVKQLRKDINIFWKTIYRYLGNSLQGNLDDDLFLKDHWTMYYRYARNVSKVYKDDLLHETFTANRVFSKQLKVEEIKNYIDSLQSSIEQWFNIINPEESNLNEVLKTWLARLKHVGIGSFRPLLMAALLNDKVENDKKITLAKECERFRFLVSRVTERRSNTSDTHFYNLAHEFYVSKCDIDFVTEDVKKETDRWTNISQFITSSVERYRDGGFYKWNGIRYFLYEYEKHLQQQTTDKDTKVNWEIFEENQNDKITIEHIYPQTPKDEYWELRFDTDSKRALVHSLGNLLLLSRSKNTQQQNYSFDKKKNTTRDNEGKVVHNGYDIGSHSEIEVSKNQEWTPVQIIRRGKSLLEFLLKHWEIAYSFNDKEINQLLNIKDLDYKNVDAEFATVSPELDYDNDDDETENDF